MKLLLTLVCCVLSAAVFSQMPSHDELVGQALNDYGNVVGGLSLNKRCAFLDEEESSAFGKNVETITSALTQDIGKP